MVDKDKRGSEAGRDEGKALEEGARGGVILPIEVAPMDIVDQVGGLPPAGDAPADAQSAGADSGEE
jgi:hypothetical protein